MMSFLLDTKKIFLLSISILVNSTNLKSQVIDFQHYFSPLHEAFGDDLIFTTDSSYLLAGVTSYHNGNMLQFVDKIDRSGNLIWSDTSDLADNIQEPVIVYETSQQNYLSVFFNNSGGCYLRMYDQAGSTLWFKFIQHYLDFPKSVLESGSNLYVFGSKSDSLTILKIDFNGNILNYRDNIPLLPGELKNNYTAFGNEFAICHNVYDTALMTNYPAFAIIDTSGNVMIDSVYINLPGSYVNSIKLLSPNRFALLLDYNQKLLAIDSTGNRLWQVDLNTGNSQSLFISSTGSTIVVGPQRSLLFDQSGMQIDSFYYLSAPIGSFNASVVYDNHIGFLGYAFQGGLPIAKLTQLSDTGSFLGQIETDFEKIVIYPNPCAENVRFNFPYDISIKSIKLIDVYGRIIIESGYSDFLNISHLGNGIYFLSFYPFSGKQLTRKIIKN